MMDYISLTSQAITDNMPLFVEEWLQFEKYMTVDVNPECFMKTSGELFSRVFDFLTANDGVFDFKKFVASNQFAFFLLDTDLFHMDPLVPEGAEVELF